MMRPRPFTNKTTIKLIREVKKQPCLWNKGDETYNDVFRVGIAWMTIASQIGLPEDRLKLKWKNLRHNFHRMVNQDSLSDAGDNPFFNEMLFLLSSPKTTTKLEENSLVDTGETEESDVLPHSDEYYDLLFLESLAPYFQRLEPVRRVAMRTKIQNMLMKDIEAQIEENLTQD